MTISRSTSLIVYLLANAAGILALVLPFLAPDAPWSQTDTAPVFLATIIGLSFLALLLESQSSASSAKTMALLGVLVSLGSALRFVEVAIPGPGGFSPVFFLIIVTGYVFGGREGFLMGALTLLVSALVTGGIGPWLPAQMLTAGWVGLSAGAVSAPIRSFVPGDRAEIACLAAFGVVWGFLYGVVINLWFWPYTAGTAATSVDNATTIGQMAQRYAAYYLAASLVWDVSRAVGNAVLIAAFGRVTLRALRRFHRRFAFQAESSP